MVAEAAGTAAAVVVAVVVGVVGVAAVATVVIAGTIEILAGSAGRELEVELLVVHQTQVELVVGFDSLAVVGGFESRVGSWLPPVEVDAVVWYLHREIAAGGWECLPREDRLRPESASGSTS